MHTKLTITGNFIQNHGFIQIVKLDTGGMFDNVLFDNSKLIMFDW
jgi:hypothetical protein